MKQETADSRSAIFMEEVRCELAFEEQQVFSFVVLFLFFYKQG